MASPQFAQDTDNRPHRRGFMPGQNLRYRFTHSSYAVALDAVERALRSGAAAAVVVGTSGSGKTLLAQDVGWRQALDENPVARVVSRRGADGDLLRQAAAAFGLKVAPASRAAVMATLVGYLNGCRREGRTPLLVVDQAHEAHPGGLKELWLLGNPRTPAKPTLQLLLVGEPGLLTRLQQPLLARLWASVGAVGELAPLDAAQTRAYVLHRLVQGGWPGRPGFSAGALRLVHARSCGLPLGINRIMATLVGHRPLDGASWNAADVERVAAVLRRKNLLPDAMSATMGGAMPPIGPALRRLDATSAIEAGAYLPGAPIEPAARPLRAMHAAEWDLAGVLAALRRRVVGSALRRRLGLIALVGMTVATSAAGVGSTRTEPGSPGSNWRRPLAGELLAVVQPDWYRRLLGSTSTPAD